MIRCVVAIAACLVASVAFAETITLVRNGAPTATIVLPPDAGPVLTQAAAELSSYVEKLSGVGLPTGPDGGGVQGVRLVLGDDAAPLPAVEPPREQSALETYSVRVADGNIYFGGRSPEAIRYAVLAFIEDNLGVRWFAPGELWEYLPPHQAGELTVEVSSRVVTPDTPLRVCSFSGMPGSWDAWVQRNRGRSTTRRVRGQFSANTIHLMFPPDRYGQSNPDYYPLENGKRFIPPAGSTARHDTFWPCVSNPDVVRAVVDAVRAWFDSHPDETSFSLAMNDVTHHCRCAGCIAMDRDARAVERDDLVDRTCAFVNAVAKDLRQTHPGRYLGMLIYRHLYAVPAKVQRLEDNVFIYITCDAGSWWGEAGAALEAADTAMTRTWAGISALPLSRYTYTGGNAAFTPAFFPHLMDRQMKLDQSLGMEGQYTEFYTFLPHTAPMAWALFRLLWDADLDIDALLREFYVGMFGSSAEVMAEYYALLERAWSTPRPGRTGGFLTTVRNAEQQCLAISPEDIRQGLALLDGALAAEKDARVRERIAVVRAALEFTQYGVESFWHNRALRSKAVGSLSDAEAVLGGLADYAQLIGRRTRGWSEAEGRQDILGEAIRALKSSRYLMADNQEFGRIDNALIPVVLDLLDWYHGQAPDRLPAARKALESMGLPASMDLAITAYGGAVDADNLLSNPGFEQAGQGPRPKDANDDWDSEGAPAGWSVWVRPWGKRDIPESKAAFRPQAGRNGSAAVALSAGTGGAYIATREASPEVTYFGSVWLRAGTPDAAGKAWCRIIFKDDEGRLMSLDSNKRVRYEDVKGVETEGWQRLAVCATAPPGATSVCLMFGHDHADAEVVFDDATLLLAAAAPASSDFEAVLAAGAFRERCRGRLSGRGVARTAGRAGGTALRFTPGPRGGSSFVAIAGIADEIGLDKAMTVEAWIQVDPAHAGDTMEILGNPVTDRGGGFRLYLDRAGVHFISGTGGVWKEAKTWGAHSGPEHPLEPGRWHHLAGTYDGSVFRVFIDGHLAGSSAPGMPLTKGKPDIGIGSFRDGLVLGFGGMIADVNLHDKALPEAEIRQRANNAE